MQIIKNSSDTNHAKRILGLCKDADELVIASPFCFPNFDAFVSDITKDGSICKITFITTMKNEEAVEKIEALLSFCKAMEEHGIDWKIRIDNKLHGKVYIFKENDTPFAAIITSANLTQHGLEQNHEWGCLIENVKTIGGVEKQLLADADIELTNEKLTLIKERADKARKEGWKKEKPQAIQIDDILCQPTIPSGARFFIKPIGSIDNKVRFLTDKDFKEQHFAKRPRAVRIGDILITYAVGTRKVVSVFQVTSTANETHIPNDRWHWYVEAKNLTERLSETWTEKSLIATDIARRYAEKYDKPVTQRGGYNLNGLRRGNDKIQLTDEFGRYLFDIAMKANEE